MFTQYFFCNQIKRVFQNITDQRVVDLINIRNIRNVYTFSVIVCVFDVISLILFTVMNRARPGVWQIFLNVSCCIVACGVVAFLSRGMIRKYNQDGIISNCKSNALVTSFYVLLSAWGILVDTPHYSAGEQMLTFYIVQFCFVCFVVMRPAIGCVLITLSFSSLYLCLYLIDGAVGIQPQNYIIFVITAALGNSLQHMMLQESEKHKVDILELNQLLQQEASVDDLTKLKNRKSLRNDFGKHIGHYVHVVMADVDHFKSYNDTYGHVVGDQVLRRVASVTMELFRDGDAYRYGGDEFLIVLSDHAEAEFKERIAAWTAAIQSIQIPGISLSITCSYGYDHRLLATAEDLRSAIQLADERLYAVKKAR